MEALDTKRPRLMLVLFCLLTWLPGFFSLPPTDRDESRFAQASKQMIETGDFVRIMNGTEPRNRKPIGIHWLQVPFAEAASALGLAADNPIWPYRLPSLAGALVAVLATFGLGEALVGRRAALLAAGMLGASVILVVEAHLAKTDAALVGATTVAMGLLGRAFLRPQAFGRGEAAVFWLAMAAGVLLKGPITPMVAGLAALVLVAVERRAGWLRALRPGWGVPLAVVAVLPWFVAIGLATHGAFFHDAIGGDLGRKLASGDDAHGGAPGLHLLLLPLLAFPSSLAVLLAIPAAWRRWRDPAHRFLLAWVVPSWIVFEAVPTKLPHYTLPLYPAIFLLAASGAVVAEAVLRGRWATTAKGVTILVAAILLCGSLALPMVTGAPIWLAGPAVLGILFAGWLATRHAVLALAAMPLLTFGLLGWELPRLAPLWLAPRIVAALHEAGLDGARLGTVGFHEPSLVFLAGTGTDLLPTGAAGADALGSGEVQVAAISDRDQASFSAEMLRLGRSVQAVATLSGFNYSRGRRTGVTLYRLEPALR